MLNVCIVVHHKRMCEHAYYTNIYMLNVSICLMYALLYTTVECVNTLPRKTINMLNVSML